MKTSRSLLLAMVLSAFALPAVAAIRPCPTPITLSPATLTGGTTGLAYSQTLTASGGTAYTFSITKGGLPPGFALTNPTATTIDLTGPPTIPGTFVFTLTARNTPNGCSGGRTFALFVNDRTVVATTPGTTAFIEDAGAVVVDSGVTVTDTDSPNLASATATITNPQDGAAEELAATACAGLTVTPGLNALSITGSQPPATYQSCLRSVTYDNSSQNPGTTARVLSFVANDGIASSATANKTVSVAGTNDPPVANPLSPPAFAEDTAAAITLSYADPEGDLATACAVAGLTNVTISTPCACSTGVCTVGVTGTLNYNGPASFSYTVTANAQTSNSATASLTITAVNDAPVLGGVSGGFTYTENDAATAIAAALTVTDVDSATMSGATITVSTNFQSGQDVLIFVNGGGMGNVAVASNVGGVLTLTSAGSTATRAQWETALRAVRYNNSSDDPNTSVRTVTFQINDGAAANNLSNQPSRTITVVAVNDAPSANAFANLPAQAGIPIAYPAGKLGGTDLEAGTTITIDLTPINVTNGTVSLGANGSFTLTPLPAATTASFQYRVSDNGNPAPGLNSAYVTVSFTVAGPAIYFVRSAGAGNCTLGNECTLAQAVTNIGTSINARIFISDANSHGSAVALNSGGWLIGQGVTGTTFDALFGIGAPAQGTLAPRPSLAGARPTVTSTVTLNTNGSVRGLNISTGAAPGITDPVAAITGALVSEVAVTTSTGTGVNFSNTAGAFSFDGLATAGGAGVSLTGANSGGTFSFAAISISSGANAAFTATGGGTVTATQDNVTIINTLATTTGAALNVANTTIGASGLTFRSISANGGANGIVLDNTGTSAGLTVTGTGTTDGSGGTVQNMTTRGASIITAVNITLRNMNFTNTPTADFPPAPTGLSLGNNTADNAAIHLQTVTNATLDNLNINGSAEQGINGHNVTTFTLTNSVLAGIGSGPDEDGIHFFNMLGTCAITNTTITGSGDDNINIQNNTNLALPGGMTPVGTLTITGGSANTGVLGSGYLMGIRGTMNTTVTINSVTADNNFSGGIVIDTFDTATSSIEIMNSTSTNNNDGISLSSNNGNTKFDIHDNVSFAGTDFGRINILKAAFSTTGTLQGKIRNNPVVVTDGQTADGVFIFQAGAGALTAAITNNSFDYRGTQRALLIQGGQDGGGTLDTTVTGNTFDIKLDGTGNAVTGILAQAAVASPSGDNTVICADLGGAGALGNVFTHSLGGNMAAGDIRTRQRFATTFKLPGYGGSPSDNAAVVTYLTGRNTLVNSPTATATNGITSGDPGANGYINGACQLPVFP